MLQLKVCFMGSLQKSGEACGIWHSKRIAYVD